jgi:hypothetical protein
MNQPDFKINDFVEIKFLNMENKKIDKHYFKIISIRTDRLCKDFCNIQGFRLQKYEYVKIRTVIEPIDDCKDKKFQKVDVYRLQQTEDKQFYYKYSYMQWKINYSQANNRILNENELYIKHIQKT